MRDPSATAVPDRAYLRGVGAVLLAGGFLSFGGLVVRLIAAADPWQILFYRSIALIATLMVVLAIDKRAGIWAAFRAVGRNGLVAAVCIAAGSIGFIFSITHTTVANTLFMLSASPLFTAVLAWIVLGERVSPVTWVAIAGAVAGVAVMVGEGIVVGALFGNLTALGAALAFAAFMVAIRRGRTVDMLPAVCISGLLTLAVAGIASVGGGAGLAISLPDLLLCAILGAVQIGGGLIVITIGSRHVPAAEVTLLSLSEVVLGPVWVLLALGEVPSGPTMLGGAILLSAIAGQALASMRRRP